MTKIPKMECDVIVIGGGAAGVGAAAAASQTGARTLLIERGPCLGGAATQKNVLTYCGLYTQSDPSMQAVGGVASAVLDQLRRLGGIEAPVRLPAPSGRVVAIIDPEATKLALDRVVAACGAEVLLHTTLVNAAREGDAIASIIVQDDRGPRELSAKAFVDASGEGNLAALSGSSIRYGNHGAVQVGTMAVRFAGIRPGADRSPERWREAIRSAKAKARLFSIKRMDSFCLYRFQETSSLTTLTRPMTHSTAQAFRVRKSKVANVRGPTSMRYEPSLAMKVAI